MLPPLRARRDEILIISACGAFVALFLFISGLAESFSRGRVTIELLLVGAALIVPFVRRSDGR